MKGEALRLRPGQAPLLFVYNADSGLFNTLADMGHKIFSPETYRCDLCALTHGYFQERAEWKSFVASLGVECRFQHRDEFRRDWPADATSLPAVFRLEEGRPIPCLDRDAIATCGDLDGLKGLIRNRC